MREELIILPFSWVSRTPLRTGSLIGSNPKRAADILVPTEGARFRQAGRLWADMSSRDKAEAERAIGNALFVLECIVHNDQHLRDVGNAIDAFVADDLKRAAILAHAIVKARSTKNLPLQTAVRGSLSELQ